MIKFKTLKDIEMRGSVMHIAHNYEDIRQEVIKQAKQSRESYSIGAMPYISNETINWIKEFFNITEGDLK